MSNKLPDLRAGEIIPEFTLPGADGMPHSPWDYKQREHLLLLILPSAQTPDTHSMLRLFAKEYTNFRVEKCALLAITPDPVITTLRVQEELNLPFPLLGDPEGITISRYTGWDQASKAVQPNLTLADMYNALYQRWTAEHVAELPNIETLLVELGYLNKLCSI